MESDPPPEPGRFSAIPNPVPHIYRAHELSFMLAEAGSKVYVIRSEFKGFSYADMAASLRAGVPGLEHVVCIGGDNPDFVDFQSQFIDRRWETDPTVLERLDQLKPGPDDPAVLLFTSGTSGKPKAALHTHNTIWSAGRVINDAVEVVGDDVIFMAPTVGHLTGFYWGTVSPLSRGAKVVYQDEWNARGMLDMMAAEGITWTLSATPFALDLIAEQEKDPRDLSTFTAFACGGAPIPPQVAIESKKVLGVDLVSLWGMTEVGVCSIHHLGVAVDVLAESDGRPVDYMDLRIVDDALHPVVDGEEGRLQVRGPSIILGYRNQPDMTLEAHTPDGWFETGDLGRKTPLGGIRITGRSKDILGS